MNALVTIEEYDKAHLAQVAVLALENAGIQCYLENETIVAMDWFISNAVGGIRLQVTSQDEEAARRILTAIKEEKKERLESTKDTWIAFRCGACKKPIAFSGGSLGRVESCPKCGKYVDVPTVSDPTLEQSVGEATIQEAKSNLAMTSGGLSIRGFLMLEVFVVLCFAYFMDLYHAVSSFIDLSFHETNREFSIEYVQIWLSCRSFFVLACMAPILMLNGIKLGGEKDAKWNLPRSILVGVALALLCFTLDYFVMKLESRQLYTELIRWPIWSGVLLTLPWYFWFVCALIANSVAEELVMRAYLIDRLEKLFGKTWMAVVVSALLFGSYHLYQGFFAGFVGATLTGLVLGTYFAKSRRLFPLIVAHTTINILAYAELWLYSEA